MNRLQGNEFALWSNYVYALTRITLDASKGYLIETRLAHLLKETNSQSFRELHDKVIRDSSGTLRREVIGAITTNETSFFRDTSPFDMIRYKILPDWVDRRRRQFGKDRPLTLRIWSAACSTGQEVYSTAIVCRETLSDASKFDIRILGTDISDEVIARASRGSYNKLEIDRGLLPAQVQSYFRIEGSDYRVRDPIRAMTAFRTINLLDPLSFPSKFDIVLCRNVAIYFSDADRRKLFASIAQVLVPDGCLLIGATESLVGVTQRFEAKRYLRSVFYQLTPSAV